MLNRRSFSRLALCASLSFAGIQAQAAEDGNPVVVLETSMGNITVELDGAKAPKSTENFLKYVEKGHYNGVIFHRVIPGFMIQTGGMNPDMSEKGTDKPIRNESRNGLTNKRGTLAMARTANPHSATAQFFVNLKDNAFLDQGDGYAVFGKVIEGMEVVDKIAGVRTTSKKGHDDVPVEPITIKSAKLVPAKP